MNSTTAKSTLNQRARALWLGATLIVLSAVCALIMFAFNLGVIHGAFTALGLFGIYLVPATLFNWPRIGLTDIVSMIVGAVRAVVGFVLSLFGL